MNIFKIKNQTSVVVNRADASRLDSPAPPLPVTLLLVALSVCSCTCRGDY